MTAMRSAFKNTTVGIKTFASAPQIEVLDHNTLIYAHLVPFLTSGDTEKDKQKAYDLKSFLLGGRKLAVPQNFHLHHLDFSKNEESVVIKENIRAFLLMARKKFLITKIKTNQQEKMQGWDLSDSKNPQCKIHYTMALHSSLDNGLIPYGEEHFLIHDLKNVAVYRVNHSEPIHTFSMVKEDNQARNFFSSLTVLPESNMLIALAFNGELLGWDLTDPTKQIVYHTGERDLMWIANCRNMQAFIFPLKDGKHFGVVDENKIFFYKINEAQFVHQIDLVEKVSSAMLLSSGHLAILHSQSHFLRVLKIDETFHAHPVAAFAMPDKAFSLQQLGDELFYLARRAHSEEKGNEDMIELKKRELILPFLSYQEFLAEFPQDLTSKIFRDSFFARKSNLTPKIEIAELAEVNLPYKSGYVQGSS